MQKKEKFLVTSALTYANGKLHIGHVAGSYLNADVFVRFHKLLENDIIYIGGTDDHGAPISIVAEKEKTSPQKIADRYNKSIKASLEGMNIQLDNFSGTSHKEHHRLSRDFFLNLLEKGYITKKTTKQFFDEEYRRFLPDRYVEGTCPFCGAEGARGDQCDKCGKLIDALTLKNPISKLSGKTPIIKETSHWYLDLPKFEPKLRKWLETKSYWKDNVRNFILSWLNEGLIERSITRDLNWGVPVPLPDAEGKVLYVWFDAPIGYISSTKEWAIKKGKPDLWKDYWLNPETKLIHFLGKDNIPFHTIIWPSMLMSQKDNYILPYDVPANEYLNIEGKKISTSKNWAVWVEDYLKYFDGELLRYVLAVNAPETKDSDFTWKDFQLKVNSELNNILGNLANRTFVFSQKYFNGTISKPKKRSELSSETLREADSIIEEMESSYRNYKVRKAAKLAMDLARLGNKYFDETHPWKTVKTDKSEAAETLYVCSELLRKISIVFSPIMPTSMKKLRKMLSLPEKVSWQDLQKTISEIQLGKIEPLFHKITDEEIEIQTELLESSTTENEEKIEHKPEISYDDFAKLELRIVKVISADYIPKSNKLLKLKVKIENEEREIVAGIKQSYKPEELVGKRITLLVNLKPRKVMGVVSNGMVLSAEDNGKLAVLVPDREVRDGSEIS